MRMKASPPYCASHERSAGKWDTDDGIRARFDCLLSSKSRNLKWRLANGGIVPHFAIPLATQSHSDRGTAADTAVDI